MKNQKALSVITTLIGVAWFMPSISGAQFPTAMNVSNEVLVLNQLESSSVELLNEFRSIRAEYQISREYVDHVLYRMQPRPWYVEHLFAPLLEGRHSYDLLELPYILGPRSHWGLAGRGRLAPYDVIEYWIARLPFEIEGLQQIYNRMAWSLSNGYQFDYALFQAQYNQTAAAYSNALFATSFYVHVLQQSYFVSHTGLRLDHQRYMDPYRRRWIDYRREYTNGPYVACNCYRGGPVAAEVPCPKLVSRIRSLVERRIVRLTESFHGFHHCDSFYTNFRLARPNSCYECMFGGFFRGARLDGSLLWNENQFLSPVPLFDFDYSRNSFSLNGIYPANMGELRRVYREEHSSLEEIIGHENSWGVPMNGNLNLYPVHPDYFYNRVRRIPALNLQMGGSIPMVPQSPIPAVVSAETTTRESTTLESIYY